jgi:hypothetical protein
MRVYFLRNEPPLLIKAQGEGNVRGNARSARGEDTRIHRTRYASGVPTPYFQSCHIVLFIATARVVKSCFATVTFHSEEYDNGGKERCGLSRARKRHLLISSSRCAHDKGLIGFECRHSCREATNSQKSSISLLSIFPCAGGDAPQDLPRMARMISNLKMLLDKGGECAGCPLRPGDFLFRRPVTK